MAGYIDCLPWWGNAINLLKPRDLITISEREKRQIGLMSRQKKNRTVRLGHLVLGCTVATRTNDHKNAFEFLFIREKPSKYLWSEPGSGSVFSNMDPISLCRPQLKETRA